MERYVTCVIFAFFSLTRAQQFRSDYKYNPESDAFYKLHVDTVSLPTDAEKVCSREGANLMVVSSNVDVAQAVSLLELYPGLRQAWIKDDKRPIESEIFDYSLDRCTAVTNTWKVHSILCHVYRLPFICKVNASDVFYDSECQVFSKDYEYVAETNSCYRIPKFILTWDEANNECNAQGAHLVIINSEAEDQVALRIFQKNSNVKQLTERPWWFYAGFRANKPDDETSKVFRTVFNETLGEVGYVNWEQGEPNNANGNEYCGVVYTKNGEFNDVDCSFELLFMCEKNIDSASS